MSIITATAHFIFQTEITDPLKYSAARRQGIAVASACEADLAKLEDWFGLSGSFGSSNLVNVVITDLDYGLGNNDGYQASQANTIRIIPFSPLSLLIAAPPGRMDFGGEASRAVFVAELAELLMGCRNQRISDKTLKRAVSWYPANSMGEALSTVCEALLHPNGYYGPHIQGPRIDWWLNYSSFTTDGPRLTIRRNWHRPNYVDRTDNTDRYDVSYGCGIVFIYYLKWLGYSMKEIIASGGTTLEETYKNLTGRSGGWKAMTDLLNLYLPERPLWS